LEGTLLPISPNGLVVLCAIPALAAIQRVISGHATAGAVIAACFYTLACIATLSRTALLGMAVAIVLLALSVRTIQRRVAVALIASVPVLFALAANTTLLGSLLNREESASNLTLNSRTIAWEVVLQTPFGSLQKWAGAGLSVKTVSVRGQYWNEQVLDSSWVSALAQTGLIGTVILAVLVAAVLVINIRGGRRNALPVAILVFLLIRAFLETGLLDSSVTFLVFLALASTFIPSSGQPEDPAEPSGASTTVDRRISVPDGSYKEAP
jgi:O-antigen ligase